MSGFAIIMFIFALCVFLSGLFMFTGHKIGLLEGRVAFKNLTKEEWKNIGKWTMISSMFIYLLAIIGLFIE
jgi:hypothetical protein